MYKGVCVVSVQKLVEMYIKIRRNKEIINKVDKNAFV